MLYEGVDSIHFLATRLFTSVFQAQSSIFELGHVLENYKIVLFLRTFQSLKSENIKTSEKWRNRFIRSLDSSRVRLNGHSSGTHSSRSSCRSRSFSRRSYINDVAASEEADLSSRTVLSCRAFLGSGLCCMNRDRGEKKDEKKVAEHFGMWSVCSLNSFISNAQTVMSQKNWAEHTKTENKNRGNCSESRAPSGWTGVNPIPVLEFGCFLCAQTLF